MNWQKVHNYGVMPPGWLWFVLVFLVAAVLVVRSRPAWLLRFWLGAWLLVVAGTLLWLDPSHFRYALVPTIAEVVLANGIPSGLVILWLHRTRRHRMLSRAPVQLVSALVVFLCGLMILATIAASVAKMVSVVAG